MFNSYTLSSEETFQLSLNVFLTSYIIIRTIVLTSRTVTITQQLIFLSYLDDKVMDIYDSDSLTYGYISVRKVGMSHRNTKKTTKEICMECWHFALSCNNTCSCKGSKNKSNHELVLTIKIPAFILCKTSTERKK